jgi:hypothetical protein
MSRHPFHSRSRRHFLRGAAGATLALPFLPSLASRARAGTEGVPHRVLFVYAPQQESERFLPSGSGRSFDLAGTYLEPLGAYRVRMTVLHGMYGNYGHSMGHSEVLSGFPAGWDDRTATDRWMPKGGPTLDQFLADRAGETPLHTLGLTISDSGLGREDFETSWRRLPGAGEDASDALSSAPGPVVAVPHIRSPSEAYTLVFGTGSGSTPMVDRSTLLRRSLIDSVIGDYERVSAELALADRQVLDAHLTQLREHELRLGSAVPFACEGGAGRPAAGEIDRQASARLHMDTIAGAFRCDATRVATFTFGPSGDEESYDWLGISNFHQISHANLDYSRDPSADHARVRRWQIEQLAYLLDRLAEIPEGDGTVLDHTTIVWLCELGMWDFAYEGNTHSRDSVPAIIIGDAGGSIAPGQLIDAGGAHFQRLHLTLLQALGHRDVTSWGTDATAPLPGVLL